MKKSLLLIPALISLSAICTFSQSIVAAWLFDGNVNPTSTTPISVTNNGVTFVADRKGAPNKAAYFNGRSNIDVNTIAPFNSTGPYSISLWAKPETNANTSSYFIFTKANPSRDFAVTYSADDQFGTQFAPSANSYNVLTEPNASVAGSWYHIVAVYDGTTQKIYNNNILTASRTTTSQPLWTGTEVQIGSLTSALNYKGALDDLSYFTKALSQAEVTYLYNGTITSLSSDEEITFKNGIYPNPTEGLITLQKSSKWFVNDIFGNSIASGEGTSIDLSTVNAGVFYIKTNSGTFKVIKK
ncbi:MAG: hypothetical protein H7329_17755 [Opitutaceae bacterium]|nr:hypothetical protein [Cytophagales bacterium]